MQEKILGLVHGGLAQVEANFYQAFSGGLLECLFPGFGLLEGCGQGTVIHCEGDVLAHTGKVVFHAAQLLDGLDEAQAHTLLVAALVHDICKPETRRLAGQGKVTFYGHAELAARRCPEFARALAMSPLQAQLLEYLVAKHMHVHDVRKCNWSPLKRRALYQSSWFPVLRRLQEADAKATWKNEDGTEHMEVLREFFIEDERRLAAQP